MAKISRGRLSTPIGIIRTTGTRSKTGSVKTTDSQVGTAWCELLPISTTDFVQSQATGASIDAKLHVDLLTDINTTDKVRTLDGSNMTYEVLGIMPVPQDNKKILVCRAILKN